MTNQLSERSSRGRAAVSVMTYRPTTGKSSASLRTQLSRGANERALAAALGAGAETPSAIGSTYSTMSSSNPRSVAARCHRSKGRTRPDLLRHGACPEKRRAPKPHGYGNRRGHRVGHEDDFRRAVAVLSGEQPVRGRQEPGRGQRPPVERDDHEEQDEVVHPDDRREDE